MLPMLPRFTIPEQSMLSLAAATPARITPHQAFACNQAGSVQHAAVHASPTLLLGDVLGSRSMNQRTTPPAMMPALRLKGRYIPTAKGIT